MSSVICFPAMDSTLSFYSLPFVDSDTSELVTGVKNANDPHGNQVCLPSQDSHCGSDDVFAQFLSLVSLTSHLDEPLEEPDLNGPTVLHCEICKKQFDNAKKYYGHLRVHSKENSWVCDKCPDQKFSTKQQLMKHNLSHKPLQSVWRCQQCDHTFEALWRLQQHLLAKHIGSRKHKCVQCEKSFLKPSDLKKHLLIHTNSRPQQCPSCDMSFKDKSNLKRHILTHTNEKPYKCLKCGNNFKQLASMKRHQLNCTANQKQAVPVQNNTYRKHYCRVCGCTFQYKSALLEHCVREHTANENNKLTEQNHTPLKNVSSGFLTCRQNTAIETNNKVREQSEPFQKNIDMNRTDDNIVDHILSVEDEYMTRLSRNDLTNIYTSQEHQNILDTNSSSQEINKETAYLYTLDDELLYSDIDFDTISFQNNLSHVQEGNAKNFFNNDQNSGVLFDYTNDKNVDQDIMNVLYSGKEEYLTRQEFDASVHNQIQHKVTNTATDPEMAVNECATIFESDVDLEASANLAANLNQLIGENNVQYIYTEDDDTFIISLNSTIDAEQLTNMLNIGVDSQATNRVVNEEIERETELNPAMYTEEKEIKEGKESEIETRKDLETIVDKFVIRKYETPQINRSTESITEKERKKKKTNNKLFVCKKCNKLFKKRDNYKSHIACYDASLRRHKCTLCTRRFAYRSTLNKHRVRCHEVTVLPSHACHMCEKSYRAQWMLKVHIERDHKKDKPYKCTQKGCEKAFFKSSDLEVHIRYHNNVRPYKCTSCDRTYTHVSHLRRHERTVDCRRFKSKTKNEPS